MKYLFAFLLTDIQRQLIITAYGLSWILVGLARGFCGWGWVVIRYWVRLDNIRSVCIAMIESTCPWIVSVRGSHQVLDIYIVLLDILGHINLADSLGFPTKIIEREHAETDTD